MYKIHTVNDYNTNETHLNFRRPTFPLVVAPSGNARSGRFDSKRQQNQHINSITAKTTFRHHPMSLTIVLINNSAMISR